MDPRALSPGIFYWLTHLPPYLPSQRIVRKSGSGFHWRGPLGPVNTMRYLRKRASDASQKWFPLLGPMI
jgi:hypothetical protein